MNAQAMKLSHGMISAAALFVFLGRDPALAQAPVR